MLRVPKGRVGIVASKAKRQQVKAKKTQSCSQDRRSKCNRVPFRGSQPLFATQDLVKDCPGSREKLFTEFHHFSLPAAKQIGNRENREGRKVQGGQGVGTGEGAESRGDDLRVKVAGAEKQGAVSWEAPEQCETSQKLLTPLCLAQIGQKHTTSTETIAEETCISSR